MDAVSLPGEAEEVIFRLNNDASKGAAISAITNAPIGHVVRLTPPTRTLDQNAKLWPMLGDIARQVVWHGSRLTDEEWKDVFTAALKRAKVVPGLDGGFVVLGQHTSSMSKSDFSELIELILAFGAEHSVMWSDDGKGL